jgi:hypothetical protein
LLSAVVEVALDLASCLVGGLDEPSARRRQFGGRPVQGWVADLCLADALVGGFDAA